jgi:hypothetical protein
MTTMIVELYEALRAAGAPDDKAQAAAKALAEHDRRFGSIEKELAGIHAEVKAVRAEVKAVEGQVTMVKWMTGATFAGILALILRTFVAA